MPFIPAYGHVSEIPQLFRLVFPSEWYWMCFVHTVDQSNSFTRENCDGRCFYLKNTTHRMENLSIGLP